MKKTLTRALSLILVLVTLIGVMPTAFALGANEMAAKTMTLNATEATLQVGGKHQITVTGLTTENDDQLATEEITATYAGYDDTIVSVDAAGKITALKAGSTTVTVTGKGTRENWSYTHVGTATLTVTVEAADEEPTYTAEPVALSLLKGTSETLDPTSALDPAYTGDTLAWTLSGGNTSVAIDGMKISGTAAGTATITASTTVEGIPNVVYNVTVIDTIAVSLSASSMEVKLGEEKALPTVVTVPSTLPEGVTPVVLWSSADPETASVDNNTDKIEGVALGETTVTATVTIEGYTVDDGEDGLVVEVEVVSGEVDLACENASKVVGGSVVLEPTLKIAGVAATNVEYEFTRKTGSVYTKIQPSEDLSKAIVSCNTAGLVEVEVKVKSYKLNGTKITDVSNIEPLVVLVRFFESPEVVLTLATGKTRIDLTDTKVFSKVVINETDRTAYYKDLSFQYIMEQQLPVADMDKAKRIKFSDFSAYAPGQIVNQADNLVTESSWIMLAGVLFDQIGSRTGTTMFNYEILDENNLTLLKGTCSIVITGGEGDIHYETSYNKPITLKETDFLSFWSEKKLGSQYTLKYVTFDTTGMTGTLYTDSTKKTVVRSSMHFYITPVTTSDYDLGSVYYVPASNKTAEYIDSFNFTAVDLYGLKPQYGSVTVELNAKSTSITSRGVVLGTTHSKAIADTYSTNTGAKLGYVVFDLPEAKYGKLYRELPSETKVVHGQYMTMNYVAEGTPLQLTDKMSYDTTKRDGSLSAVAFVPAAGFKGEVELTYIAYDIYGGNPYEGSLRLTVSTKTASSVFSDVTARSYSWAADSADFLFYEGVAQGSKAAGSTQIKYNPSANITRRDFMLMLYRAFLADDYGTLTVTSNFPDVVKGTDAYSKEIYQAVGVAKYLGIAQGSNDKFNPKANITRQEAMVLIYRTLDVINRDLEYSSNVNAAYFKDYNKVSSWAATSIIYLVNHGVIQGSNDKINPTANITRAEMACILHRVLTY